jgi:hypothetical protein
MSQFIRIRISQGSSSGPYTIYYNQVTPGNVAQIYGPTTPYLPATNVPFSQLTGISGYLIIVVPDTAYQIILVDNVNPCPPIIQPIPVPTPTATVTPTPTPTSPLGGAFTLQWSILPSVLGNIYFDKDPVVSRPFNYYSGIQIDGNGFNQIAYRPLETVTNNGIVSSRDIVVLDMTTFPRTVSIYTNFLIGINQPTPINCTIKVYRNGVYMSALEVTVNNSSNTDIKCDGAIYLGPGLSIQDNDVIKIEIS